MYSTDSQVFVPLIIHRAYENDYVPFEEAAVYLSPGSGVSRGVYFSVTCSEGVPFISEKDLVAETAKTFVGPERVTRHMQACRDWPRGEIPANYIDLVRSDVPVLMISGEIDGSTPPWFGTSALKFLPNGRQLKIRYLGHQIDGNCLRDIFTAFVKLDQPEILMSVARKKYDGRSLPPTCRLGSASIRFLPQKPISFRSQLGSLLGNQRCLPQMVGHMVGTALQNGKAVTPRLFGKIFF